MRIADRLSCRKKRSTNSDFGWEGCPTRFLLSGPSVAAGLRGVRTEPSWTFTGVICEGTKLLRSASALQLLPVAFCS